MKILFVTSGAYIPEFTGGIESTIHDMSVLLQQRGISPGVMARLRKRTLRARLHGARRLLGLGHLSVVGGLSAARTESGHRREEREGEEGTSVAGRHGVSSKGDVVGKVV